MPDLLIRNVPDPLHQKLGEMASRHHRSMTREALAILERAIQESDTLPEFEPPLKGRLNLTDAFLQRAKSKGRP